MATPARQSAMLAALVAGVLSYTAIQSLTVPTLPRIQEEVGASATGASWIFTAFLLSSSIATPILGRLGDAWGKRRMLLVCLGALFLGSLVAALAGSIETMIVARVVQGIGGGAMPLAFGIINDELAPARVPSAIGFVSSLFAVGFGAGLVVAGPLVEVLGCRWLFLVPMMVAGVSAVAVATVVPRSRTTSGERLPLMATVTLSGWLTCLLLAISKAPDWGWWSGPTLALAAGALALLAAWVWLEGRASAPLVDLALLRLRGVWSANLVAMAIGAVMYGAMSVLPRLSQEPGEAGFGYGATASESGLLMLPMSLASFASGICAARLARRFGERAVMTVCAGSGATGLALFAAVHESVVSMLLATAMLGLCTGGAFACVTVVVLRSVPHHRTGVAAGTSANIRTVGGALGTAVSATVIAAGSPLGGAGTEGSYVAALAVLASLGALAAAATYFVPHGRRPRPV